MSPERWQQINQLFEQALTLPLEQRADFLAQACGEDETLRTEVLSLLVADDKEALIAQPLSAVAAELLTLSGPTTLPLPAVAVGTRLGAYRITGLVGQGGMGAVYAAVRADDQYQQKVAIKLVKADLAGGGVGAESVLQRFRRERQILARLEHPNIARLLDGGTTPQGWPYLVMEYIEGEPLTEYCNKREVPVSVRLELFRAVCAAVQHAHQNLIIHRDLKPGNILVTQDRVTKNATVKLLDFGIAKLLDPELTTDGGVADFAKTATALRVMTPDYASPEQARGEAVTTATDVYSLGVVLYELLTGVRPHRIKGRSFAEIERAICDTEPERPSEAAARMKAESARLKAGMRDEGGGLKLGNKMLFSSLIPHPSSLKGDLDNIILMALRKEPARRYQSVEQFAEDIRRHLDGLPVSARQDTVRYRTGKFVRRHRWGVAASVLMLLLLLGSAVFSSYQARRAERRFQQVRKLANTFLFEFDGKIQNITGTTEARELLVKTALEYLDSLAQEAGNEAEFQYELASAYARVGDVQGYTRINNLGHSKEALASYGKARALVEPLAARASQIPKYQRLLADLYYKEGSVQQHLGAFVEALASYQRGVTVIEPLTTKPGVTAEDLVQLLNGYRFMGELEVEYVPAIAAGVQHERKSMEVAERRAREFPSDRAQFDLAGRYVGLAYALLQLGDPLTAKTESEAGLALLEPLAAKNPTQAPYRRLLYLAYQHLGFAQGQPLGVNLNEPAATLQSYAKMLAIAQQFLNADAKDQRARDDVAVSLILIGETEAVHEPARGAATLRRALEELHTLAAAGGNPFRYRMLEAETLTWLADAENRQGNRIVALNHLREAQTVWQTMFAEQPNDFSVKARDCEIQQILAEVLWAQGDFEGAFSALQRALTFAEAEKTAKPTEAIPLWRLADCYQRFGACYEARANRASQSDERRKARQQACDWYKKSLQQWDAWPGLAVSSVFNTTRRDRVAQTLMRCRAPLRP